MTLLTSIYSTVIANIEKSLGQGGSFFLDSVADHNINISKWNVLAGSSYTKLPNKWEHPRKGLLIIDSSECFKCCLARYPHPADHHPAGITKTDKDFEKNLIFKT